MSWVLEGFDRSTEQIAVRIELPSGITEDAISTALGSPVDIRFATWPVTEDLVDMIQQVTGQTLDLVANEYFVEYQVKLK